jgi:hypothetical protein
VNPVARAGRLTLFLLAAASLAVVGLGITWGVQSSEETTITVGERLFVILPAIATIIALVLGRWWLPRAAATAILWVFVLVFGVLPYIPAALAETISLFVSGAPTPSTEVK